MRIQRRAAWWLNALLLGFLTSISMADAAEPIAYKVEMLIFINESGVMAAGGEPAEPLLGIQEAVDLQSGEEGNFRALPATELELATADSILEQSGRYDVIEDIAWTQPGLNEAAAKPVHIHGGVEYPDLFTAPAQSGQALGVPNLYSDTQASTTLEQLDGTVKVALGQYLHVYTDLVLRKPVTMHPIGLNQQSPSANALYQFRVQDQRRMRSGELHYLDHPLLGVLVQITPVERESENEGSEISGRTPEQGNPKDSRRSGAG